MEKDGGEAEPEETMPLKSVIFRNQTKPNQTKDDPFKLLPWRIAEDNESDQRREKQKCH